MKTTVLFIALLFTGTVLAQNQEQDRIAFIAEFMEAVVTHNEKQILKHIEKSYRKEQIRFLKGNKVQFINELFSGINENETYITPELDDISGIELIDIKENSDGNYTCSFEVETSDSILYTELFLVYEKRRYGFVGAVG